MNTMTNPRSLSKTIAIASISLLAAGFVTALGIGLRGLLWEIRTSQAEMQKAQAQLVTSQAEMQKAQAALEQAHATIQASVESARGQIEAATRTAEGTVLGHRYANFGEVEVTQKLTNPLINNPSSRVTEAGASAGRIDYQLKNGVDTAGRPLTSEQRKQLLAERETTKRQLELAQQEWLSALTANGEVAKSALSGLFQGMGSLFRSPKKPSTETTSAGSDVLGNQSGGRN